MKTLYIHIGTPKTATTAIQFFCTDNSRVLEKMGYCYPKATKKYPYVSLKRNGHFLSGYVHGEEPNIDDNIKIIEAGMMKVKELFLQFDNVILSDESIWRASSYQHSFLWEMLSNIARRDGYVIKIVVYLRRQDNYIMSIWNQMVKYSGETDTWDEYFDKRKNSNVFKYYKKLKEIENFFGKENMIVRRFDKNSFVNGSIFHDFLNAIGIEWSDDFKIKNQEPNTNLPGNMHEMQRMINCMESLCREEKRFFSKMLQQCTFVGTKDYNYSMMSKEERECFLELFRKDNEKIANEYICDGKPMFDYDVPDLPKWNRNNPYFIDDVQMFNTVIIDQFKSFKNEMSILNKKLVLYNRVFHPIRTIKGYLSRRKK